LVERCDISHVVAYVVFREFGDKGSGKSGWVGVKLLVDRLIGCGRVVVRYESGGGRGLVSFML
jgi:hypothetical protein